MASRGLTTTSCDHVLLDIQVNTLLYSQPKKYVHIDQLNFSDDQFWCLVRFSRHGGHLVLTGRFTSLVDYGKTEYNNATICVPVLMIIILGYRTFPNGGKSEAET